MSKPIPRRQFLQSSAAANLAYAAPLFGASRTKKYRTALIGSGWWGMNILRTGLASGRAEAVAMCDVDANQLDPAVVEVNKLSGDQPKKYKDYRELIATEKPDIVIVGTPDHWHPLITIAAIEAGAHVYVEKPISHTVHEGWAMVQAARKHGRSVQVGTHRRVSPHNMSGMKFLREGKAGDIGMVRCFVHRAGGPGKPTPDADPPAGLDWDMWCGPAPLRAFNPAIHPKGFRNFLDYANGTIGDWAIHWFDQVLWWSEEKHPKRISSTGGRHIVRDSTETPDTQVVTFEFESFTCSWGPAPWRAFNPAIHPKGFRNFLDYANGTIGDWAIHWFDQVLWWSEEKHPKRISSTGGRHIVRDSTETPDTQVVTFEFESFTCAWEHRWYAHNYAEKSNIGVNFYGTEGIFHMGWLDGWSFYPSDKKKEMLHEDPQLNEPDQQNIQGLWDDLLESIETGRRPVCDIEVGHQATVMSLLGMVSQKLGRSVEWDPKKQAIPGDPQANKLLRRDYRSPWKHPEA